MHVIRDKTGKVIGTSQNLAGVRRYAAKNVIKTLAIDGKKNDNGKLSILFDNGASFEANFGSFEVLKGWVRGWRNAHGATLLMNGKKAGKIDQFNKALFNETLK